MNITESAKYLRFKCLILSAPVVASVAVLVSLAGCTQVKPQAEFNHARGLIAKSTGITAEYDPEKPTLTSEQLDAILDDGLTLEEALRLAVLNNRRLQKEFMSIGVAKADWVQSGLLSNPSFAFSAQLPEGGGRANIQASVAQNLVDLWQIPVRKRVAQTALDETVLRIARFGSELAANAKAAYYRAVAAEEALKLADENHELMRKSYEAVKAQREAGLATELDENLSKGQMLRSQLDVRNSRLAMHSAKRQLARHLSIAHDVDDLQVIDSLPILQEEMPPAEALIELARSDRLDLRAASLAVESSAAKVDFEKLNILSEFSVGPAFERGERRALYGRKPLADFARDSVANGAPTFPSLQPPSERDAERRQEINSILGLALTMTVPIFDQNQAQIAKAFYLYQQDVKTYEELYLNIAQDIRMAADRTQTAANNVVFYRDELIPQAERNQEFANASYTTGQSSILTLLEAQRLLLEAKRGYIEVRLEAGTAVSDLERAVGVPAEKLKAPASSDPTRDIASDAGE